MGTVPCSVCQNVLSGFWLRISSLSGSPEQARARLAADWSACNKEQLWSRSSVAPQRSTNWYVRQHCCCAVGFWSYGNELEEGRFFVLFDGGWMMGDCWEASACGGGVQTEVTTPAQYEAAPGLVRVARRCEQVGVHEDIGLCWGAGYRQCNSTVG